ncbi:MAG: glycine--tRNA ligase [Candidatus Omnitrophica bacterium]|nr:glycine--tRNA ligase [Candidatus Omnitrophota bacterium]MBU1630534.1 glycine--tRNA ligase [Candidatus Omnitrophota bacterium]MBU1889827.1 glycine--tRNA ligase [Candidatus Omnitrophota bacterium]
MDKVVSLCKRRGLIFQSSDIYGGLANTWDYGPYGVELKNNVKRAWWKSVVYERDDILGMDAAILMHPKVWEASGHVNNFFDLKSDCKSCKKRFKAEDLKDKNKCPECGGELTEPKSFNLMFETNYGSVTDKSGVMYLRPETAQGMFVNFANVLDSRHPKLPFGLAQIGKAFRNEITPGNFTFRTREFEQMEIEYFVRPEEADKKLEEWIELMFNWYIDLGINKDKLRKRPHEKNELAHYAKACTDIEYNFPFGWSELEGIANRTDFDLKQHSKFSGKELQYFDNVKNERFYPYIIEPSGGVDRSVLAFLVDAYHEEKIKDDLRVVLKLHKDLAPVKVAILPLLRNRPEIVELAKKISRNLKKDIIAVYDDTGAIGKLYRRQDEVGTPFCVTVDVQSLEDKKVTVRERDTMQQERIDINNLKEYLQNKLGSV